MFGQILEEAAGVGAAKNLLGARRRVGVALEDIALDGLDRPREFGIVVAEELHHPGGVIEFGQGTQRRLDLARTLGEVGLGTGLAG